MRGESAHDTPKALGEMANRLRPWLGHSVVVYSDPARLQVARSLKRVHRSKTYVANPSSSQHRPLEFAAYARSTPNSYRCSQTFLDHGHHVSDVREGHEVNLIDLLEKQQARLAIGFGFPVAVVIVNDEPFLKLLRNLKALSGKKYEILLKFLEIGFDVFGGVVHLFWGYFLFFEDFIKELIHLDRKNTYLGASGADGGALSQPLLSQQPQRSIHCAEQQQVLEPVLVPEAASLLVVEGGSRREICSRAPWQRTFPRAAPRLSNRMEVQEKVLMRVTLMRTSLTRRRRSSQRTCYLRGNGIVELMTRLDWSCVVIALVGFRLLLATVVCVETPKHSTQEDECKISERVPERNAYRPLSNSLFCTTHLWFLMRLYISIAYIFLCIKSGDRKARLSCRQS
ncbi:hypothetical protein KCU92_g329, partial [Aureobasidium melanogenum]